MIERIRNVAICGVSAAVPRQSVAVADCKLEGNWARFERMTGIRRRRICPPELFMGDLAERAASALLAELGWEPDTIGLITVVTQTPDMEVPAMACILQHRLGMSRYAAAKDVNLGCSGYAYGLVDVARHICPERLRGILIVGEITGKLKAPIYAPMFGDCVTATALRYAPGAPDMLAELMTDGSRWSTISERRICGTPPADVAVVDGEVRIDTHYTLKGPDVYSFAMAEVPPAVRRVATAAGRELAELDAVVLHQASMTINANLRRRLGLTEAQTPTTLEDFGNTSSATIPLTLHQALTTRRPGPAKVMMCGFGVGLSWGTLYAELGEMALPQLVEV